MIDDPTTVDALMEQLEAHLPIPAFPTKPLVHTFRKAGAQVSANRALSIKHVFYHGDEGGIACDVTPTRDAKQVFIVSLTYLVLPAYHPLSAEVRAYQRKRLKRIGDSELRQGTRGLADGWR